LATGPDLQVRENLRRGQRVEAELIDPGIVVDSVGRHIADLADRLDELRVHVHGDPFAVRWLGRMVRRAGTCVNASAPDSADDLRL
jgi:hypothetical protein